MGKIFEQMLKTLKQISADKRASPLVVEEKKVPSFVPASVRVVLSPPEKYGGLLRPLVK